MKKLFTLLFLCFSLTAVAQVQPYPDIDTITTDFRVQSITGSTAKILSSHGSRNYEVSVTPELNPFGYILEVDREFRICIEVDHNLIYQLQTRGQTGTVPASILWFTVSSDQLARDMRQLQKQIEEEPGYDRSPRYH